MCDRPLQGCSNRARRRKREVSTMTSDRTILITGVTGNQGGAVAQALQGSGFRLRGLTRKPESEQAAALARHGVEVVKGDLDDEATLRRALAGAWGVFGVQNTLAAGGERGEGQGERLGGPGPAGGAGSGKRRRASVWRRWPARPASNTTSTHPWDRRTSGRASRTSTTSGASRKPCAAAPAQEHHLLLAVTGKQKRGKLAGRDGS